jgi:hypothetical protein
LNPEDHKDLLAIHGHTWLAVYYDPAQGLQSLTRQTLPDSYRAEFSVYYRPSRLEQKDLATPALWRSRITDLLSKEADLTNAVMYPAPAMDIRGRDGMTARDFQP